METNMLENKKWLVKQTKSGMMLVCPYCNKESPYPFDECEHCKNKLSEPNPEIKKKEWW